MGRGQQHDARAAGLTGSRRRGAAAALTRRTWPHLLAVSDAQGAAAWRRMSSAQRAGLIAAIAGMDADAREQASERTAGWIIDECAERVSEWEQLWQLHLNAEASALERIAQATICQRRHHDELRLREAVSRCLRPADLSDNADQQQIDRAVTVAIGLLDGAPPGPPSVHELLAKRLTGGLGTAMSGHDALVEVLETYAPRWFFASRIAAEHAVMPLRVSPDTLAGMLSPAHPRPQETELWVSMATAFLTGSATSNASASLRRLRQHVLDGRAESVLADIDTGRTAVPALGPVDQRAYATQEAAMVDAVATACGWDPARALSALSDFAARL